MLKLSVFRKQLFCQSSKRIYLTGLHCYHLQKVSRFWQLLLKMSMAITVTNLQQQFLVSRSGTNPGLSERGGCELILARS